MWRKIKLLRWLVGALVACYLGSAVTLVALENRLLYHNRRAKSDRLRPMPSEVPGESIYLTDTNGQTIHAWWCPYPGARRAVLYCHGNVGDVTRYRVTARLISKTLRASVFVFDYPGFGCSSGEPSEAGCYAAGDAAYEWLTQQAPSKSIIILGQSLGGGVATDLASRQPHRALALFKTFTSFPDVAQRLLPIFPARWMAHNRFDNEEKICRCSGPLFVAHGDSDHLIPISHSERLFQLAANPKRFVVLKGQGHHGSIGPEFLAALGSFLDDTEETSDP